MQLAGQHVRGLTDVKLVHEGSRDPGRLPQETWWMTPTKGTAAVGAAAAVAAAAAAVAAAGVAPAGLAEASATTGAAAAPAALATESENALHQEPLTRLAPPQRRGAHQESTKGLRRSSTPCATASSVRKMPRGVT
jgi:hypothetical protein